MASALQLFGFIVGLFGFGVLAVSRGPVQEIFGIVTLLIAAVCMIGGAIVQRLDKLLKQTAPPPPPKT